MGEARAKKLAGIPRPETPAPRPERFRPTGVKYTPAKATTEERERLGEHERHFMVHRDGGVFEVLRDGGVKRPVRVRDEWIAATARAVVKKGKADRKAGIHRKTVETSPNLQEPDALAEDQDN